MRKADVSDIPALLKMGRKFFSVAGVSKFSTIDTESLMETFGNLMENGILLIDDGGMIGGLVYPLYYNHNVKVAQEFFWWVDPDKRGSGLGSALLDAFENEAKARGASVIFMVGLDEIPMDALYRKKGLEPMERTYVKWQ